MSETQVNGVVENITPAGTVQLQHGLMYVHDVVINGTVYKKYTKNVAAGLNVGDNISFTTPAGKHNISSKSLVNHTTGQQPFQAGQRQNQHTAVNKSASKPSDFRTRHELLFQASLDIAVKMLALLPESSRTTAHLIAIADELTEAAKESEARSNITM